MMLKKYAQKLRITKMSLLLVNKSDISDVFSLILNDIAVNTYIIGNLSKYGLNNSFVHFYVDSKKPITFILMQYYNDFVFYTKSKINLINKRKIAEKILQNNDARVVSGGEFSISQLVAFLPQFALRVTWLLTLRKNIILNHSYALKNISVDETAKVLSLLSSIDEFKEKYRTENAFIKTERLIINDKAFGYYDKNDIIAFGAVTAESKYSCMLTDICVHEKYRGKNIGTFLVTDICEKLLKIGISSINLYVDNPNAFKVYKKVGFDVVGKYLSLTKKV